MPPWRSRWPPPPCPGRRLGGRRPRRRRFLPPEPEGWFGPIIMLLSFLPSFERGENGSMRFSAAGNFPAGAKLSQPLAAGSQFVNSCFVRLAPGALPWARNAGTGNVRPFGGHHDVTRRARSVQVLKVPKVTSMRPLLLGCCLSPQRFSFVQPCSPNPGGIPAVLP